MRRIHLTILLLASFQAHGSEPNPLFKKVAEAREAQNDDLAMKLLSQLAALQGPDQDQAQLELTTLYIMHEDYDLASSTLAKIATASKLRPQADLLLAVIAGKRRDFKEADQRLKKVVESDPTLLNIARFYRMSFAIDARYLKLANRIFQRIRPFLEELQAASAQTLIPPYFSRHENLWNYYLMGGYSYDSNLSLSSASLSAPVIPFGAGVQVLFPCEVGKVTCHGLAMDSRVDFVSKAAAKIYQTANHKITYIGDRAISADEGSQFALGLALQFRNVQASSSNFFFNRYSERLDYAYKATTYLEPMSFKNKYSSWAYAVGLDQFASDSSGSSSQRQSGGDVSLSHEWADLRTWGAWNPQVHNTLSLRYTLGSAYQYLLFSSAVQNTLIVSRSLDFSVKPELESKFYPNGDVRSEHRLGVTLGSNLNLGQHWLAHFELALDKTLIAAGDTASYSRWNALSELSYSF